MTRIEILCADNKDGAFRGDYLKMRSALLGRGIDLVEMDLLLGGEHLPARDRLPPGDFCAFVSRRERRPKAEVYAWSIRRALPKIPIPLKSPDTDVLLDLPSAFRVTYDRGRYDRSLRYDLPLPSSLSDEDRSWATARAGTAHR